MQAFDRHRGIVAPLPQSNVDTDQIAPARYLHRPREEGYGDVLFTDLRVRPDGTLDPDFILNRPGYASASILVTRGNFGCGSSREHAVWALVDHGIRVVVAPSFGDIFYNNAMQNGLLAVRLEEAKVERLLAISLQHPETVLDVDLQTQTVVSNGLTFTFDIDAHRKESLLHGLSETTMTLRSAETIKLFEKHHIESQPWLDAPHHA
ncbi:3-isopropylmalate dehydratase small subunit [Aurantimonas sp. A2-1-M11]|uniref:3-isopropylmalate dehydratase small subunit n=1 Tax=Aurantimonas sp. A2-1-M11 TaxID=3113712 RepID=UPI002F922626